MKKEVETTKKFGNKEIYTVFGIFLLIGLIFYITLYFVKSGDTGGNSTGDVVLSPGVSKGISFGLSEIIYSIAFAFIITGFLLWIKSIMLKNAYLGLIIGLLGAGIVGYGISLQYWGPYTIGFMGVAGLFIIGYLGRNFYRYKKESKSDEDEFEEK